MYYQNPSDREHLIDALSNTGSVKNYTVHLKKKDGTKVTLETCSQYMYDEDGNITGIEGVLHDVTEVKEVENELKESNRILNETIETLTNTQRQLVDAEKMAALGNLVAGVAHEINTPVGICVTAASFLQEKTNELSAAVESGYYVKSDLEEYFETADDAASMILSNLNRASELVSSFKKVAVDQSTEEKRIFNLKEYIHEILISIRPKYKKDKHRFKINCPDDLTLHSYPGTFFQIISNLIMNSLIHGFADEAGGEMGFDVSYDGTDFILIYSDNGIGMDEDSIKQVFDPFFTTRRGQGGTGLGMNIVYNLVTMKLNGRITCDSLLGEGTSFFIAIQENSSFRVVS
jgi:signal transduction histidine kinase